MTTEIQLPALPCESECLIGALDIRRQFTTHAFGPVGKDYRPQIAYAMACDKEGDFFKRTLASFERFGITPAVLTMGHPAWNYAVRWRSYIEFAQQGIDTGTFEYVVFVDAWDSCLLNPQAIYNAFAFYHHPFIIGAEANCWPDASRVAEYEALRSQGKIPPVHRYEGFESPYKYLNAGVIFAECKHLVEFGRRVGLDRMDMAANPEDQWHLLNALVANPDDIMVDTHARLAWNLYMHADDGEADVEIAPDGLSNSAYQPEWAKKMGQKVSPRFTLKSTGTRPAIAHGNGKSNIARVYYEVGL